MAFAVRSSIPLRVEAVMLARPSAVRAALGLLVRPCGEFSYARTGATARKVKVDSPLRSGKPATGAASRRGVPVFTSQTCVGDREVPAPEPLVHVNDRAVLHVARLTHPDRRRIAAQHGPVPDAHARGERHIP